ncbi:hypothetical protein [Hymenobacter sp.]|uniref:toxin-antitoxin system YwqK family antitoxin n=1 Tax=Hymenobacter sp. TaxID=1898978 RepID=UPI00286A0EC8|nr:hypothetical protein [Hymenobacter sp.]
MIKHLLTITALLLLPQVTIAQAKKAVVPPLPAPDTVYFDRDWERTTLPEDRVFARIARHDSEGKTAGTVRDYFYPSWKKQWEGKLVQEQPDLPQGLCIGWYESGQMNFRGTYTRGQQQGDFKSWGEDGHLITCSYAYQEALPLSKSKLHSYYNSGSSRQVFPVDLPANTAGVVYRLDIRDEGQLPISGSTAMALGAAYMNPIATATSLLATGSQSLAGQAATAGPPASTKCHWYIVPDEAAARQFLDTKGSITGKPCYRQGNNICAETREIAVAAGTRRLYICINNDNETTAATATLSVSALVQTCK